MRLLTLLPVAGILLTVSCGISEYTGGASDHGNERVAGAVTAKDGAPVAGAMVTLLPDDYNPITDSQQITPKSAVSDSAGRYVFDSLETGIYTISAYDNRSAVAGIAKGVTVESGGDSGPVIALRATGSIYFPVDSTDLAVGMMIYLPGTERFDVIDSTRKVNIFDVPAGLITLRAYDPSSRSVKELGKDFVAIEILPGVTLLLPSRSPQPYCVKNDTVVSCGQGLVGEVFTFSPIHPSKKIDGNYVYRFSWGEGTISAWSSDIRWQWSWDKPGDYFVQAQVMRQGSYLAWSEYIHIRIDANE